MYEASDAVPAVITIPDVSRAEVYLDHLDRLCGGAEAEFFPVGSPEDEPRVSAIVYRDLPETGHLTAFTYGLSLAEHPDWRLGRPELSITVYSDNPDWGIALAYLAANLGGECPFSYGNTVSLGEPVEEATEMSAFAIFAASVVPPDQQAVDVGEDRPIRIVGAYPVHAEEAAWIGEHGLEAFWKLDWDLYDVARPPVVPSG